MADDGMTESRAGGRERREHERFDAELSVDWSSGENFLFAYITNISEMGIFIRTDDPPQVGASVRMRFAVEDQEPLSLDGMVVWVNPIRPEGDNPNPGMGVRFSELSPELRERVVDLVRTVAYLQDEGGD